MAKGASVFSKAERSFIHEPSGTLVQPGENEITDSKVAKAILKDHSDCCYADAAAAEDDSTDEDRSAEVDPDDEDEADEEGKPKGKASRKK